MHGAMQQHSCSQQPAGVLAKTVGRRSAGGTSRAVQLVGACIKLTCHCMCGTQVFRARPNPWGDIQLFGVDVQALYAVSIVVFGFNCHANVVSVFAEMEHYPNRIFMRLPAK